MGEPSSAFKALQHSIMLEEKQTKADNLWKAKQAERARKKAMEERQKQIDAHRRKVIEDRKAQVEAANKAKAEAERKAKEECVEVVDGMEVDAEKKEEAGAGNAAGEDVKM